MGISIIKKPNNCCFQTIDVKFDNWIFDDFLHIMFISKPQPSHMIHSFVAKFYFPPICVFCCLAAEIVFRFVAGKRVNLSLGTFCYCCFFTHFSYCCICYVLIFVCKCNYEYTSMLNLSVKWKKIKNEVSRVVGTAQIKVKVLLS